MPMDDYANGAGPGGGLGNKHGQIGSPLQPCPYSIEAGGGKSIKGGEPNGPFGKYLESPSALPIVGRDGLTANMPEGFANTGGNTGRIQTPMDNPTSAMPGVTGSDGTGPTSGGGAKISSPFSSPWGDMVGS